MNPYSVQAQLLGPVAVVTLCGCARRILAAQCTAFEEADHLRACLQRLDHALDALPPQVRGLVLDLDGMREPCPVTTLHAVRDWAEARSVDVVVLDGAPAPPGAGSPGAGPSHASPTGTRGEPGTSAEALLRTIRLRTLARRAAGIRQARREGHPCGGGVRPQGAIRPGQWE
ncbi:hypothetical protein ACFW9O_12910 [Streptomyces sp. NPDC059499]|uniref:hypothetical protein n=1 Tax=Streptomyces sp. NPDC059499 TaxID=3346852 RepID=UPI00369A7B97